MASVIERIEFKMNTAKDIREKFLSFFSDENHEIVPSSPLVPHNDPTLMFTNAGMNQFKNVFTGAEKRDYNRAATTQKCVRAGGKHNDLENVGRTARHHTFFEMLGNFSFGDYFKEGSIEHAWNLITKEFAIPKEKLLVTVYAEDTEAYDLWRKIAGLPQDRIIKIGTSDNFWQMGDTGPCGPCSEIFYDHGEHLWGGPPGSPEEDGDRWVEIWNLVFMQYDQLEPGKRINLPKPSIDTGMGLERITAVLQGVHDNYDIDLFKALIENSAHLTNSEPYDQYKISHRVIADHLRSMSFLIADGVLPSNEGRGYVLRRIMRRAMRHVHMIGHKDAVIYKMLPKLIELMGSAFPEIKQAEALMTETIRLEEERFQKTLDRGLNLLDDEVQKLGHGKQLSGDVAFKLYDTYGFPLDLTEDVLKAKDISVDIKAFDEAMERQKAEARKNWAGSGETAIAPIWFELKDKLGHTEFLGYEMTEAEALALCVLDAQNTEQPALATHKEDEFGYLVVNQTPFYGESGGQIGDTGHVETAKGKAYILDTQKYADGLFVHKIKVIEGQIHKGDSVKLIVDEKRRKAIKANHSATHLLHEALRSLLGEHVTQKGSLVTDERLRFDISHTKGLSKDELKQIEALVNEKIQENTAVTTQIMSPDEAQKQGAMALFGEKYGAEVRVVSMGGFQKDKAAWSVELCGGIHVKRTGDIGSFKILSEAAVAAGVRRIEAVTAQGAMEHTAWQADLIVELSMRFNTSAENIAERLEKMLIERKSLEKEISDLRKKLATANSSGGRDDIKEVKGVKFAGRVFDDIPAKDLKSMADEMRKIADIIVLISKAGGKASIVVAVNKEQSEKWSAVDLVKIGSEALGGKGGGGRADLAQAGGPDAEKAQLALKTIEESL